MTNVPPGVGPENANVARSQRRLSTIPRQAFFTLALALMGVIYAGTSYAQAPLPDAGRAAAPSGFQDAYADVNGVRIHYVVGGTGSPVLLVPGWPETWFAWRQVMPKIAEHHTVIAVDTRGMGESSRPMDGYDMTTVANDLFGLMEKLGHGRFMLVGHDIGAWIGYAMAADRPQLIERMALMDANVPGVTPSPPVFQSKEGLTHSWHFMFNQLDDLPEALTQGRERAFLTWLYSHYAYKPNAVASEEYIRTYSVPGAMRAGFAYYRALPQTIDQNRVRSRTRLPMPILALGGAHGTADMLMTTLKPQADQLDGGVIDDCGHYVPEECPGPLLERLVPFLGER